MRAAKAPIGSGTAYGGSARKRPAVPEHGARARISFGLLHFWLLFFGLFFLGYLGGIYAGRDGSDYGSTLAQYYMDGQNYTSLLQVFPVCLPGHFYRSLWYLSADSVPGPVYFLLCFLQQEEY